MLPWLLGLLAGLLGTSLSHLHLRRRGCAACSPSSGSPPCSAAVILLGVRHPQSLVVQGSVFAGLALGWLALRARRASATVHGGTSGWGRLVVGTGLVALASALAVPASALVMGDDDGDRAVVRNWVEPPFDIGRYPSPLAGFRKYVDLLGKKDAVNVHDRTLFTVYGVPEGTRVRIATMDHYDGMVWGATDNALPEAAADSFQRVSSTIDNPVDGTQVDATVTIGEAYDGVWLPTVGALRSLDFRIGDPDGKAEAFRYNLATSTAVVPTGLSEGDTYSFTAVVPDDSLDATTVASSAAVPPPEGTAFLKTPAAQWTAKATTPIERVRAIAEHLRTEGKYSDGVRKAEQVYHPGHSIQRLSTGFVQAEQMVGNDEQYAALMALLAGEVGVPARVVLGAEVPEGGVVTGKDVSAWVELRAADGSWRTLPTDEFMSDEPPADQLPETNTPMTGTVVPPPAPDPAAVGRRRPERRRPQGAQGRQEGGRRGGRGVRRRPAAGLGGLRGDVRRGAAARGPAPGRRGGGPQAAAPPPPPQRGRRLGPLRRGLARARRPRPRPRPAGAAGPDRDAPRAVRRDRVRPGAVPGPPGRRLRLRSERPRCGRRAGLLGDCGRRAALDVAVRRTTAAAARGGQPPLAAADRVVTASAPALIGLFPQRLTKLACRPNVGCVSWCLAAAGTRLDRSQQRFVSCPG